MRERDTTPPRQQWARRRRCYEGVEMRRRERKNAAMSNSSFSVYSLVQRPTGGNAGASESRPLGPAVRAVVRAHVRLACCSPPGGPRKGGGPLRLAFCSRD